MFSRESSALGDTRPPCGNPGLRAAPGAGVLACRSRAAAPITLLLQMFIRVEKGAKINGAALATRLCGDLYCYLVLIGFLYRALYFITRFCRGAFLFYENGLLFKKMEIYEEKYVLPEITKGYEGA